VGYPLGREILNRDPRRLVDVDEIRNLLKGPVCRRQQVVKESPVDRGRLEGELVREAIQVILRGGKEGEENLPGVVNEIIGVGAPFR
jgi:hypothetical protein